MVDKNVSTLERRSNIRVKEFLPAEIQFINGSDIKRYKAWIEDISEGGVCVSIAIDRTEVKKEVYLKLNLPGLTASLDLQAFVIWVKEKEKETLGMGLRFSNISLITLNHIKEYIQFRIKTKPLVKRKEVVFKRRPLNKLDEREYRNLNILEIIAKKGPIAKAQISQITGLNIGTLTNYIDIYIKKGLVLETGLDVSSGGRRPILLELNSRYGLCIGVDVSNSKKGLIVLLCDTKGNIINKYVSQSKSPEDFKINNIIFRVKEMIDFSSLAGNNILGIGVATSRSANFTDLNHALEREFQLPVLVENSCCASLFAERIMNPGLSEIENILYFSLANSECGLVINGDLYRISSQFTINLQNDKDDLRDACWREKDSCPLMPLPAYDQQNIKALSWDIGLRLAILTNILKPQVIILGDLEGRGDIRDYLFEIKDKLKKWSINDKNSLIKIFLSKLDREAAALGVALLIIREVFIQT